MNHLLSRETPHWIAYQKTFDQEDPRPLSFQKTANKFIRDIVSKFDHNSRKNGLLFGQVQSGKTTHTFSIIAATADADPGFSTFVYLTSNSVPLVEQTFGDGTERLNQTFEVCGPSDELRFSKNKFRPSLVVLHKEARTLKKWVEILANDERISRGPIFIVDDEGDAATPNTKVNTPSDKSTINDWVRELRNLGTGSIFLQVTATPQALFLQSLESSERPEFIHYFDPGSSYLGGEFYFGSNSGGQATHRPIAEDDLDVLLRSNAASTGITSAVAFYVCVVAYFMKTGRTNANCLIHPHVSQGSHNQVKTVVEKLVQELTSQSITDIRKIELNVALDDLNSSADVQLPADDFWEIHSRGIEINVRIMNAGNKVPESEYRADYNILIGANAIGRGVAIPHLQVVYYTRRAKTPQADTFWQHSRIFGYDRDRRLVRIFMPPTIFRLFQVLQDSNTRLIELIKSGNHEILQISLPKGFSPTRSNIVKKTRYRFIVGDVNYFPPLPNQSNGAALDVTFHEFGERHTGPVSMDIVKKAIKLASEPVDWKSQSFINAIDEKLSKPEAILILRSAEISSTGSMLSPGDLQYGKTITDKIVLTAYKVDGGKMGWSEAKPFWMINIKLPGSLIYHEVE